MSSNRRRILATLAAVLLACSAGSIATSPPEGTPDGGTDATTDSTGPADVVTPAVCPEARKRCAVEFSYEGAAEGSVEVRGDWNAPATWNSGEPLTNFGSTWKGSVLLPPGKAVQYKFCVDRRSDGTCTQWVADPGKPTTGPEANTLLADVSCAEPVCLPESGLAPRTIRFIAVGDTGVVGTNGVSSAMAAKCQTSGCDFVLLLGDNIYDDGATSPTDPQFQTKFENRFAAVHAPFYATLGNHDYGGNGAGNDYARGQNEVDYSAYSKKWRMPSRYFRFPIGDAEFFSLDTNAQMYSLDAQQRVDVKGWLDESKATWKIAFGHHPYLSNGAHGNAGNYEGSSTIPIFSGTNVKEFADQVYCGNVDLYLCGHDHSRQWLTGTCKGTQLAVSGAGAKSTTLPGSNPTKFQSTELGFLYATIEGKKLTAEFIDASGTREFTTTIEKP